MFSVTASCPTHFGVRTADPGNVIPWNAVVRIEGKRIVVRDDAV
jgi:hypothetical protein